MTAAAGERAVALGPEGSRAAEAIGLTRTLETLGRLFGSAAEERMDELGEGAARLAATLVRHALAGEEDAEALAAQTERQCALLEEVGGRRLSDLFRSVPGSTPERIARAAGPELREAALERCDRDARLVADPARGLGLVAQRVSAPGAHVRLVECALRRGEAWAAARPLLALELEACDWSYLAWTPPDDGDPEAGHRRALRRRTWALAEREALAVGRGRSVLRHLVVEGTAEGWPPRQRRLAEQLPRAVPGFFSVAGVVEDGVVEAEPLEGGEARRVHDAGLPPLIPGTHLAGRLVPYGDGSWLCSPGAVLLRMADAGGRAAVRALWERQQEELASPGLALEAALAALATGRERPRRVLPANGPADARERLALVMPALRDAGLATRRDGGGDDGWDLRLDPVLGGWVQALLELAGQPPSPPEKRGRAR